jgi:uncharacterized protein YdiU (UPF0061 family)
MRSGSKIDMIAEDINPMVRGWLNYFRKFNPSSSHCLNKRLIKWAMCKYKKLRGRFQRAESWLRKVAERQPRLFAHWALGFLP